MRDYPGTPPWGLLQAGVAVGGGCGLASCSETCSWHLFLPLGAERSDLPDLKGKGNIWNKLESGDQTARSPHLWAPGSAALLPLPRAPPEM